MEDERNQRATDGVAAVKEPLFTDEAEVEARPVVPLVSDAHGTSSMRPRGRLPQSLNLLLAVLLAGAAGAATGYLVFRERTPRPVPQESAIAAPETAAPQPSVNDDADTTTAEKDEPPARVEPERPATNTTAESRARDGEEERAEPAREHAVRDTVEEARPRREEVAARAEPQRERDESQPVRRRQERQVVRRDDGQDGQPKARLVGTITGRPRRH